MVFAFDKSKTRPKYYVTRNGVQIQQFFKFFENSYFGEGIEIVAFLGKFEAATMLIFGDCSLESGRPSSQLPVRTLLTRKRPFLVREFEFEVKP